MSMRICTLATHLRAEDAHTLIEFLDQLRDVIARVYGPEIMAMMQQVQGASEVVSEADTDVPF